MQHSLQATASCCRHWLPRRHCLLWLGGKQVHCCWNLGHLRKCWGGGLLLVLLACDGVHRSEAVWQAVLHRSRKEGQLANPTQPAFRASVAATFWQFTCGPMNPE
jgi:hypothetical protein